MNGKTGMITVGQAAALLGVTPRWIRQLSADGFLPALVDGSLPLVGAVQGYVRWLKDDTRRAARMTSESRVHLARANEIERRNARTEQSLIEVSVAESTFAAILAIHREEMAVVAAETDDLAIRAEIEARINDALDRAESRFAKAMKAATAR